MAPPGAVELAEVDPLPGAERQAAVDDRHHDGRAHEGGLEMGVGVSLGMPVVARRRDQARKAGEDVPRDVGVRVLVDRQAGRGVRHVDVAGAVHDAGPPQFGCHRARDLDELGPLAGRHVDLRPLHRAPPRSNGLPAGMESWR